MVYLSLSALAVIVRPTAMIMCLPLVVSHLCWRLRDWKMILQCCFFCWVYFFAIIYNYNTQFGIVGWYKLVLSLLSLFVILFLM